MMKHFVIFLLSVFLMNCVNRSAGLHNTDSIMTEKGDASVTSKFYLSKKIKIREALIKNGIHSYVGNDTLYIFHNSTSEIARCKLSPENSLEFYRQLDTCYTIKQQQEGSRLVIIIGMPGSESNPSNFVIVDLESNTVILNIGAYKTDTYIGSSEDGEFHAIEYGARACGRGLAIYNSKSIRVNDTGYYGCVQQGKNQLKWVGNRISYYKDLTEKAVLPKNMPKLRENEIYVQKYYWQNGEEMATDDFAVAVVE